MRLLIAALAIAASSHQGPGPALSDALWMASVTQWNAVVAWDETVARNRWNDAAATTKQAVAVPPPSTRPAPSTASTRRSSWDGVAACESGGNWAINTGNGYFGGLQMDMAFWHSHGGDQYAARPDLASKDQQTSVADRAGSRAPWPVCGSR